MLSYSCFKSSKQNRRINLCKKAGAKPQYLFVQYLQNILCSFRILKRYHVVLCGTIAKNIDTAIPNVNFVNDAAVEVDVRPQ